MLILGGVALLLAAALVSQLPRAGDARIEAAPEVVGVYDGQSYAWILRTKNGAALIDTGMEPDGEHLLRELAAEGLGLRDVHTVLLTHGHRDHWGAAHLFPDARVLVGPGEEDVIAGVVKLHAPLVRLFDQLTPAPQPPARMETLFDGQVLELDGERLRVLHLPGHTPGSVAFLWHDLLFTGDALMARRGGVGPPPFFLCEDAAQARESLRVLLELPFTRIADGHTGLTENAKAKLREALE
ncbi:MBL fold metallo-hydrolase [Aggregicoccus sp. 17bor-14]|nr:MBL fold metallo-hydrolase [Simulacricoccus sp. 17bor-14]MRI89584.1 MBL fold metallo-hydrolase [Aggregicoccus sp. 17bor-14]